MSIRAFRVVYRGLSEFDSVVLTDTPGRAKNKVWVAANEAGWPATYADLTVRRAPEFDGLVDKVQQGLAVNVKWAEEKLKAQERKQSE